MTKIIIIEDDKLVRENVQKILELEGYEVYSAVNGKEGIELIQNSMPNLILCDIMLPDMEGFDILKKISTKDQLATIPFIFLTARAEMSDLRKGMNLGADDYITKPFHIKELLNVIKLRLEKDKRKISIIPQPGIQEPDESSKALNIDDHLFLPTGTEVQFILIKDIECITADGVYTYIYTMEGKKIMVRKLLKQWEDILPSNHFTRIHKSTIINVGQIVKVEKWFNSSYKISMRVYPEPLFISRRFASKLKNDMKF